LVSCRCDGTAAHQPSSSGATRGDGGDSAEQKASDGGKLGALRRLLATHGPGAVLSYLTVSNALSVGSLCSAWLLFARATGVTPLQDWPRFLAAYAPAYAAQHAARPLKLAAGLTAARVGSAAVAAVGRVLRIGSTAALVVLLVLEGAVLLACLGAVVLWANRMVAAAC
jgi:hypothetical protein